MPDPRPIRKRSRRTSRTAEKARQKEKFLKSLSSHGVVGYACKSAKIGRSAVYEWREEDAAFAKAWDAALEDGTDKLEREAVRRAAEGTVEPVYQGGQLIGAIRKVSDTLLIFLLKARRPKVYRETVRQEHTGPDGGPITTKHQTELLHDRNAIAEVLEHLASVGAPPPEPTPGGSTALAIREGETEP